jgi:hypothetical protein
MQRDSAGIRDSPTVSGHAMIVFFFFFESHFPPDFVPTSVIFAPHQYNDIVISDIGVFLWLAIIAGSIVSYGFSTVFRVYLLPYLW